MNICKVDICNNKSMTIHPSGYCFECYQNDSEYITKTKGDSND